MFKYLLICVSRSKNTKQATVPLHADIPAMPAQYSCAFNRTLVVTTPVVYQQRLNTHIRALTCSSKNMHVIGQISIKSVVCYNGWTFDFLNIPPLSDLCVSLVKVLGI